MAARRNIVGCGMSAEGERDCGFVVLHVWWDATSKPSWSQASPASLQQFHL